MSNRKEIISIMNDYPAEYFFMKRDFNVQIFVHPQQPHSLASSNSSCCKDYELAWNCLRILSIYSWYSAIIHKLDDAY